MCYGGDGAEHALGVDGDFDVVDMGVVHMRIGEHGAVGARQDACFVRSISVANKEGYAVENQYGRDGHR